MFSRFAVAIVLPLCLAAEPLSYPEAVRIALAQRSKVQAARLMVARSEAQLAETARLAHLLGVVRRDLPARREQSALGVEIARADLDGQTADVRYAVGRMYVAVLYVTSARKLAYRAADRVRQYRDALAALKGPLPALDPFLAEIADAPTLQAENKVIDADKAEAIARAALRQAIGLESGVPLTVPEVAVPRPTPPEPDAAEVLRVVKGRNPEMRRVGLLEQVHRWEVQAQAALPLALTADTFAAGADVHATSVPPEGGDEYRPAPIVPEMPARLVGSRASRVNAAGLLAGKAHSVAVGVEQLLELRVTAVLEILREKRRKLEALEKRHIGRLEKAEEALAAPAVKGREALLQRGILAISAAAEVEAARHEYLVALLDLERLTLGAYCPGIAEALDAARDELPRPREREKDKAKGDK